MTSAAQFPELSYQESGVYNGHMDIIISSNESSDSRG